MNVESQNSSWTDIMSYPGYPKKTGKVDKIAEQLMRKAKLAKSDPHMAILDYPKQQAFTEAPYQVAAPNVCTTSKARGC